jgi:hypothetical protein
MGTQLRKSDVIKAEAEILATGDEFWLSRTVTCLPELKFCSMKMGFCPPGRSFCFPEQRICLPEKTTGRNERDIGG